MASTLLFIQHKDSDNSELLDYLQEQPFKVVPAKNVRTAVKMIDDNGLRPNAILVDIPHIIEEQVDLLEDIEGTLGIHEWVFLTYDIDSELVDRVEELSYRSLKNPCSPSRLGIAVKKAMRSTTVRRRLESYSTSDLKKSSFSSIVGTSNVILEHKHALEELAQVPMSTLLIKGETGTGKGHAAGILHSNGERREYSFIEMNCAALPQELVESQLFGHEAGSFTGAKGRHRGLLEQADNGTLFLDEIGEMPLDVQAKLLKAIEEQSFRRVGGEHAINVDVQIFAASNRDLQRMVVDGEFREDLYHRLNVFEITVPSLREYKTDLVELVPQIIAEYNSHSGKHVSVIPDDAWSELMDYDWPGNVRELRNALERAVLLSKDQELSTRWLKLNNTLLEEQLDASVGADSSVDDAPPDNVSKLNVVQANELSFTLDGSISLEEMDREIIECALRVSQNNISQAAELLGATRETLRYRIQKYELEVGT